MTDEERKKLYHTATNWHCSVCGDLDSVDQREAHKFHADPQPHDDYTVSITAKPIKPLVKV